MNALGMNDSQGMRSGDFVARTAEHTGHADELLEEQDDDTQSVSDQSAATENEATLRPHVSVRDRLLRMLTSTRYQLVIVILVMMDTLLVISELLLDLELGTKKSAVPSILHSFSIAFLCLFFIEILVKIYVYRLEFFTIKGEMFDAIVIIVALVLDIISLHSHDALTGTGLIIVLRLWRIVRVQNSIVMSVHRTGEKKLNAERDLRKAVEAELEEVRERNKVLRQRCRELLKILQENNIGPKLTCKLPDLDIDN